MEFTLEQVKHMMDVALLSPIATTAEVEELANSLKEENYCFLCIHSLHTRRAAEILKGSQVTVVSCIGFPQTGRFPRGRGCGSGNIPAGASETAHAQRWVEIRWLAERYRCELLQNGAT